ncbi:thylakoid lumenal 15 kDa protein 1, chloroplastic-like isoform X2 [Triticum dicoccoides]|uniref:thylakoid lumenal 15 kDa protein 1, chloroplastic-like isoform X2 n=1 Tax=Triticum dicoccoides TaxID=85692 RepID=UPI00188F6701|nr:thylakoid lumenal 15 kDa protein 1, chloroplastic-like isoform X2 [Triticum dicoccoides]
MAMSILGALKLAPSPPATAAQPAWLGSSSVRFHLANAGAAALVAASLLVADPALAFRGGGPYGQQVTRGQDLTGKDFSGQTLIKQDFKTSILRQTNFKGANLLGASFFDADLTGAVQPAGAQTRSSSSRTATTWTGCCSCSTRPRAS